MGNDNKLSIPYSAMTNIFYSRGNTFAEESELTIRFSGGEIVFASSEISAMDVFNEVLVTLSRQSSGSGVQSNVTVQSEQKSLLKSICSLVFGLIIWYLIYKWFFS